MSRLPESSLKQIRARAIARAARPTKEPAPVRPTRSPRAARSSYAAITVLRDTWRRRASARVDGSRAPGHRRPFAMATLRPIDSCRHNGVGAAESRESGRGPSLAARFMTVCKMALVLPVVPRYRIAPVKEAA